MSMPEDDPPSGRGPRRRLADRLLNRAERRPLGRTLRAMDRVPRDVQPPAPPPAPAAPAPPTPAQSPPPAPSPPASKAASPVAPPRPPVPTAVDRRPPRLIPPDEPSKVGRVRLAPSSPAPAPSPPASAATERARRAAERPGAKPTGVPRRTIDDYMQMLGELKVAEARYQAGLRDPEPKGPPRAADGFDDGG